MRNVPDSKFTRLLYQHYGCHVLRKRLLKSYKTGQFGNGISTFKVAHDCFNCFNVGTEELIIPGTVFSNFSQGITGRVAWVCESRGCREEYSLFRGSPFAHMSLTLRTFYFLVHFFARVDVKTTKWLLTEHSEGCIRVNNLCIFCKFPKTSRFLSFVLPSCRAIDETSIGARQRGNHGRIPGKHLKVFGKK